MFPISPIQIKLAICACLLAGSYYLGYSLEHAKFMLFVEQTKSIALAQEEKNKAIDKASAKLNERVSNDYQKNLDSIKRNYAERLLNNDSRSGGVSNISNSAIGLNGYTSDTTFVGQCAQTTLMLVSLQEWIKEQTEIYK